jgi:hypothetical protein
MLRKRFPSVWSRSRHDDYPFVLCRLGGPGREDRCTAPSLSAGESCWIKCAAVGAWPGEQKRGCRKMDRSAAGCHPSRPVGTAGRLRLGLGPARPGFGVAAVAATGSGGGSGEPGPTGPRPPARRGATAAGPARPHRPDPTGPTISGRRLPNANGPIPSRASGEAERPSGRKEKVGRPCHHTCILLFSPPHNPLGGHSIMLPFLPLSSRFFGHFRSLWRKSFPPLVLVPRFFSGRFSSSDLFPQQSEETVLNCPGRWAILGRPHPSSLILGVVRPVRSAGRIRPGPGGADDRRGTGRSRRAMRRGPSLGQG